MIEISMTRKKALTAIDERMHKPENLEKYYSAEYGSNLIWHYNRARESLQALSDNTSNANHSLLESDFDVSIREITRIMDSEGWK